MRYLFLLLFSTNLFAAQCVLTWIEPTERASVPPTPLLLSEIQGYEVQIKAGTSWIDWPVMVTGTDLLMGEVSAGGSCPKCDEIRIRTVDTGLQKSIWAYQACPPAQPQVCQ